MIIYLCIKYESNTLIFSKNIKQEPFLKVEQEVHGHNAHLSQLL